MSEKMDISNDSAENSKGIFWDAFAYISVLVSRVWSSGDGSVVASTSADSQLVLQAQAQAQAPAPAPAPATASAPASTDECKDVFTGITSSINESKYVINITINGYKKPLQLRLPEILKWYVISGGLVALSDNELVALPNFNKSNQTQQISMTQYYRADSSNNCVVIHLTATTLTKLTCERYICVSYDDKNMIVSQEISFDKIIDINVYNTWNELNTNCAGIVPNPDMRRTKTEYQYLFNSTNYRNELQTAITTDKKSNQASFKAKAQTPERSARSPVEETIKQMGTSLRMYDMMNHGVDGLSEVAEKRYNGSIDKVKDLNTDQTIKSIREQFETKQKSDGGFNTQLEELIKTTCAINDFTDLAHDVRTLQNLDQYIGMVFPINTPRHAFLTDKLKGLLTTESKNINVPNSHQIQEDNVKDLKNFLLNIDIIIPNIPTEKYESRYEMYVQLIVDLMQGVERRNYPESGKQITIETFYEFYKKLDTDNQISFCQDVQNRIDEFLTAPASSGASAPAPASAVASKKSMNKSASVPTSTSIDNTIRPLDPTTPSVKKICGLDGCPIGDVDTDSESNIYTIPNIYGLYDFNITGSNKGRWEIKITRHGDATPLLTWPDIPGNFHIILDDVIWYVKYINIKDPSFDKIKYRNKNYNTSGESDSQKQYKNINFEKTTGIHEKTLLVYSLKTAMDKLYRISGDILTEIGTIDSYVWGDVYIQYLLGYLKNLLMIYRVSDATGDGEQDDGECDVDTHALGGRGLVVHPMVKNVYTDEAGLLLMKKTLVYANWIQQLAHMSGGDAQSATPASPGSQMDGAYSQELFILWDVFDLKEFINSGQIFNTQFNTQLTLGSLIPTDIRMSNRLLNFVERFALNRNIEANDADEYDKTMVELFKSESTIVIQRIKEYIPKLQVIMRMSLTDKSAIRNAIIKLPDLEDLLGMSSPTFYVDNEDTLIDIDMINDNKTNLFRISEEEDSQSSSEVSPPSEDSQSSSQASLQNINLFTDVEFLDNGNINIITPSKSNLVKMAKDTNEYKSKKIDDKSIVITGPITLELLYKLKRYAPNDEIQKKINDKFDEIINAFKSSFLGVQPDADTAYLSSDDEGMSTTSDVSGAATTGQTPVMNEEALAKARAEELAKANARQAQENELKNTDGKRKKPTPLTRSATAPVGQMDAGQATNQLRVYGLQATLYPRPPVGQRPSFRRPGKGGSRNNSTRKRKPSKIPRQTIRRRAPRRGQKRTQKRKQKPRRTIRRRQRNKKGTQKRRK